MMESAEERARASAFHEERREGLLSRIEEKLNRLLGQQEDEWHDRRWAPEDSPFAVYSPGDPSPVSLEGRVRTHPAGTQASQDPDSTVSTPAPSVRTGWTQLHHMPEQKLRR